MADLTGSDRRKLEKMLGMGGGYVLNFSDRTFGDFFDEYRVEIDAERYRARRMASKFGKSYAYLHEKNR